MADTPEKALRGVVLNSRTTFTVSEFCRACGAEHALVIEMVDEGIIEPLAGGNDWRFSGNSLVRAQRALRLVRDLDVNWAGAALALDLLEEIDRRARGA